MIRDKQRGKHWLLGRYMICEIGGWEGPARAGGKGREIWNRVLIRKEQGQGYQHRRHICGYSLETGQKRWCISSSFGGYSEIVKYLGIRWPKKEVSDAR